jgi:Putative abortive phage resistance protein AbiGi, antitoxin
MTTYARLYPEILFHFTSKQGLIGILEEDFKVSYARERIVGIKKSTEFAVPIVSFCDLRLSELKAHMGKYGNYGIGLTKEWANRSGLNPVLYMSKHCSSTAAFIHAVEALHSHLKAKHEHEPNIKVSTGYMDILNLYRYMKNYEGDLTRNGKTARNYRFADEREWRYVPPIAGDVWSFVPLSMVKTPAQKAALNAALASRTLTFRPADIRYLIVKTDADRAALLDQLESVDSRFDEPTRRRLANRVLTAKQIANDV